MVPQGDGPPLPSPSGSMASSPIVLASPPNCPPCLGKGLVRHPPAFYSGTLGCCAPYWNGARVRPRVEIKHPFPPELVCLAVSTCLPLAVTAEELSSRQDQPRYGLLLQVLCFLSRGRAVGGLGELRRNLSFGRTRRTSLLPRISPAADGCLDRNELPK